MKIRIFPVILALSLIAAASVRAETKVMPTAFLNQQYTLVQQGFDKAYITRLFQDPRLEFLPKVVTKIAYLKKEKAADYSHFLRPEVVEKGRRYLIDNFQTLSRAEKAFDVKKEVIVAILTVESDLGKVTGKYPVFNVFASLAVMDTPEVIELLDLDRRLAGRLKSKASWGKSELKAFITYCQQNRQDPFNICGSWAGAFGFSQFLPSSLLRCGADGNSDCKVDLFNHPDAIFSIANYLHKAGFKSNRPNTWSKAVYSYNHSDPYVDTVITLAKRY